MPNLTDKLVRDQRIKKEDIKFLYRGTNLSEDLIIISAKLKGISSVKEKIEKIILLQLSFFKKIQ